ncbi:hypothetical protein [Agrococcus sp. DT81.2]|uniref:hypothetical protein n=1 Tax=Agrococcus sp. DT81.2 TaxID=3393414 RepID=UPI003CE452D5
MSVRDEIAEEVERKLDAETHDDLCACVSTPCVTYGTRIPWTHSDVHQIVTEAYDAILARFPYMSADRSLYDYADSLRTQLNAANKKLEKETS